MRVIVNKQKRACEDNRGLSLIELVVTTLMMSMVALIIMLFVSASKNSYIEVQNEVTMQTIRHNPHCPSRCNDLALG